MIQFWTTTERRPLIKRILFIGDPNLGESGAATTRQAFPQVEVALWKYGDAPEQRRIRRLIRSRRWDIVFSFYSDLILYPAHLNQIDIPLNIHPALPSGPGVGHDVLPLLHKHSHYGATLHWMDKAVDRGEIFDVLEYPLDISIGRAALRVLNQRAALDLLQRWAHRLNDCDGPDECLDALRRYGKPRKWSGEFITRARLTRLLEQTQVAH